jgi:hypothetical protein
MFYVPYIYNNAFIINIREFYFIKYTVRVSFVLSFKETATLFTARIRSHDPCVKKQRLYARPLLL